MVRESFTSSISKVSARTGKVLGEDGREAILKVGDDESVYEHGGDDNQRHGGEDEVLSGHISYEATASTAWVVVAVRNSVPLSHQKLQPTPASRNRHSRTFTFETAQEE